MKLNLITKSKIFSLLPRQYRLLLLLWKVKPIDYIITVEQLDPESKSKVSFKTFRLGFRRYNVYRTKWFLNRCSTGGETIVYVDVKS